MISRRRPDERKIPCAPDAAPSSVRPLNTTVSFDPASTVTAVPAAAAAMPASTPFGLVMVTALLMITGPKPALSIAVISPPAATAPKAFWNVLHGEPKVHGFESLP